MNYKILNTLCLATLGTICYAAPPANLTIESPIVNVNVATTVQAPKEVSVKSTSSGPEVSAKTMQDAANKAVEMTEDVISLKCGSGTAFMATGVASYSTYKNRTATLIAQREAYIKAITKAKKNLAVYLEGMDSAAKESLMDQVTAITDSEDEEGSRALSRSIRVENVTGAAQAILRGYVVFSVKEEDKNVTVKIVTSPLTRSASLALNGGMTVTSPKNFDQTFQKFYAELKSGLLPPSGSRVILIVDDQGNSHPFFIGFGSDIIREAAGNNQDIKTTMVEAAKSNASLYAASNLVKLLVGDKTAWVGAANSANISKNSTPGYKEAAEALKDDPTVQANVGAEVAENNVESFINVMKSSNFYASASQGKIPAGCQQFSWTDDNGDWAYHCIVYNPNMTLNTENAKKETYKPTRSTSGKESNKNQEVKPLTGGSDNLKNL